MRTFYIKGKIEDYYNGLLIEAKSEEEAKRIYERELMDGNVKSMATDLEIWNEIETIVE